VAAVLVTTVTVAGRAWFSTRDVTDRTVAELRDTQADVARTEDELAAATDERLAAQSTLGDQVAALVTREDERDDAQDGLDIVTLLLARVQAQLTASQTDLEQRTTRLDAFDRCLVGVAQALNQAAVNDTNGLMSTIRGIEDVCAQAGVAL
jgi:septal ring factor EnvC (AmiA/AmiB activator)